MGRPQLHRGPLPSHQRAFRLRYPPPLIEHADVDNVFCSDTPTSTIFDEVVKGLIASAVQGINATVFAYGQTASGKTHTMRGVDQAPGIIPLSIGELFKEIAKVKDRTFQVRVSYLELYNEAINDLLSTSEDLDIRESLHGIYVKGLSEFDATCPEQALTRLCAGDTVKKVGETKLNEQSSRSHTVFRVCLESKPVDSLPTVPARVSQLNLVDLAGSEGVSKTKAEGVRLREGVNINKSLLALSNVIHRLSSSAGKFINFRDSKLTRMLQPALGGNSKTAIICTMSQLRVNYQESINTLLFGVKAKRVKNSVRVNEVVPDNHKRLQLALKEIQNLKDELKVIRTDKREENLAIMERLRDMLVAREQEADKRSQIMRDFENMKKEFITLGQTAQLKFPSKDKLSMLVAEKENELMRLRKTCGDCITPDGDTPRFLTPAGFSSAAKIVATPTPSCPQDMDMVEQDGIRLLDIVLPGESPTCGMICGGVDEKGSRIEELEKEVVRLSAALEAEKKARIDTEREKERITQSAEATLAESIEECEKLYSELNETLDMKEKTSVELSGARNELEQTRTELEKLRGEKSTVEDKLKTMSAEIQRASEALPAMLQGLQAAAPVLGIKDIPVVAQIVDKLRQTEEVARKSRDELAVFKAEADHQRERADSLFADITKKAEMLALYQNNNELLKKELERAKSERPEASRSVSKCGREESRFASAKKESRFRGSPESSAIKRGRNELDGLKEIVPPHCD